MKSVVLISMLVTASLVNAADCTNGTIVSSTDETIEFTLNDDGTVTDNTTRLMWLRCAQGQTWDQAASQCSGKASTYNWTDALMAANNFNSAGGFAGKNDWRLPNINELRSIVEDCNSEPAINILLFPSTPVAKFWSSSTYVGLASNAWLIDFDQGRDNFELKTNQSAVRLVRVAD